MSKISRIKKDKKIREAYKAIRKNSNKHDKDDRIANQNGSNSFKQSPSN